MPRTYKDQYTGTNIEINIKAFHELRPDLKICWFTVTLPGLQETCRSKFFFSNKHIIYPSYAYPDLDPGG